MPLATRTFSDIDNSFLPHPITGDILKKTGPSAIVQSVMNLILTNHYEKPFHPEIGGNIRKLLFDLADNVTANLISEEIKDVLANFEPRVQVINVYVDYDDTNLGYKVTIEAALQNLPNPVLITTFLSRLR